MMNFVSVVGRRDPAPPFIWSVYRLSRFGRRLFLPQAPSENKKKFSCREFRFPAYLASVRGPVCLSMAITALLAISATTARAQALAPSKLHLAGRDQNTKKDAVQVITKETPSAMKNDAIQVASKETPPVIKKDSVQVITKQTPQAALKTTEPIRPVARYSYKTPEGKKESA